MRNRERGEGERGDRTFIIFGKLVIGLASSTSEERSERGEVEGKGEKEIRKRKKKKTKKKRKNNHEKGEERRGRLNVGNVVSRPTIESR